MKQFKVVISIFALFVLYSCATTEKEISPVVEENVKNESKMVEVQTEETFYYVTKEETFYGDGQIDTITTYIYDENYMLKNRVQINEQEEVLESTVNTIKDSKIVRSDNYGFGNTLNSYTTYEYDSNGNVITETLYDDEDVVQSINVYEYNNGILSNWITKGPNGGNLAITSYEYKNDLNSKILIKDAGSVVDGIIEKNYVDGIISEEKVLDSKGKIESSIQYLYKDELLVEKVYFDSKGKKTRSESYEYNEGYPVPGKINLLYKSGALESYTVYEYESNTVITKMMVEE
ncbi:MAG: hypothetical protein JXR64_03320 [Spirochaetales bacterium]|nr:hypothetical protein [Spirochaetales bacterium]